MAVPSHSRFAQLNRRKCECQRRLVATSNWIVPLLPFPNSGCWTPGQEIVGDGPIEVAYAEDRIRVERLALKSGDSKLRISGELPLQDDQSAGSLSVEGKINLAAISPALVSGVAQVSAGVTGSVRNWHPTGSMTIQDGGVHWRPLPVEDIQGRLHIQDGAVRVERLTGKAGTGTVRLDGSLPLHLISVVFADAGQRAAVSAQLDKLELTGGTGEQAVTATVGAKFEGGASDLSLAGLRGSVEFSQLEARTKTGSFRQSAPTRVTIADGVARLENFDLAGANASLRATGTIGLTNNFPIQLEAAGQTSLSLLSVLAAPAETSGNVRLDLRVGGTLSAPQTTGFVKVDDASLLLRNPRIQAANVKLDADLQGDHITVKEFSGNLNGGTFSGGGDLKAGVEGFAMSASFSRGRTPLPIIPPPSRPHPRWT